MVLKCILAIMLIVIVVLLVMGYFFASYLVHPKLKSFERGRENEIKYGFWRNYDELKKQDYIIKSEDGYELHATFIPAEVASNKYVIITHGYTYNRCGAVKYMHVFREYGYNCVTYDDRGHGANAAAVCTMGIKESMDLLSVIQDTYDRFGQDIEIGLHGESMGAASTVLALANKPRVKFAIADCGYADLMNVLKGAVKSMFHMPGFLSYPASIMCKVIYGYRTTQVRPIEALADNEIPICFIHGEADDFILCNNSLRMKEANKGYAEIHLFQNARHAESINVDEERYRLVVKDFLDKIG